MSAWALRARPELLLVLSLASSPQHLHAQGLPVDTGSHIPVALWFAGAGLLGLVLVYGIWRNRGRTRAQKNRPPKTGILALSATGDGLANHDISTGFNQRCAMDGCDMPPRLEEFVDRHGSGRPVVAATSRRG
jgi:hypothetical protein